MGHEREVSNTRRAQPDNGVQILRTMLEFIKLPFIENVHLDIVGLLAILGESSVLQTSQVASLLPISFLPRLLPAPQALYPPQRPGRLPLLPATVVGVSSGNIRTSLGYIPRVLHNKTPLEEFQVEIFEVTRRSDIKGDNAIKALPSKWGPLAWLSAAGCSLWLALIVLACHYSDGMALLSLLLLGAATCFAQVGLWSWIKLATYQDKGRALPPSDLVICYPNGAFQVILCKDEAVARKLYFEPEAIKYHVQNNGIYRLNAVCGTIALMLGVICLGNAKQAMQFSLGCSYISLNVAYWGVAALPAELNWNLDSFRSTRAKRIANNRYSQALWAAIALTRTTRWTRNAKLCPSTSEWTKWLDACDQALETHPAPELGIDKILLPNGDWDPQSEMDRIYNETYGPRHDSDHISNAAHTS